MNADYTVVLKIENSRSLSHLTQLLHLPPSLHLHQGYGGRGKATAGNAPPSQPTTDFVRRSSDLVGTKADVVEGACG